MTVEFLRKTATGMFVLSQLLHGRGGQSVGSFSSSPENERGIQIENSGSRRLEIFCVVYNVHCLRPIHDRNVGRRGTRSAQPGRTGALAGPVERTDARRWEPQDHL